MTAHPHAALMMEYARDAATRSDPQSLWECRCTATDLKYPPHYYEWRPVGDHLDPHPSWNTMWEFRRKPQPLECWVLVNSAGWLGAPYETIERAEAAKALHPHLRIVHFREVTPNE